MAHSGVLMGFYCIAIFVNLPGIGMCTGIGILACPPTGYGGIAPGLGE